MTITIPGQTILMDTPSGIDPVWYDKIKALIEVSNLFTDGPAGIGNAAFSAHKNGIDQVIGSSTQTKITFPTELFDVGGSYDAPNSKWTPPAGIIQLSAAILGSAATSNLYVFKNGVQFRGTFSVVASGLVSVSLSLTDQANGTDYYEIYAIVSATPFAVLGVTTSTWWTGARRVG